jgi:CxxC-x17-CxxC domain-containing protein
MGLVNRYLLCADCGREFLWDIGEQAWYLDKKLYHAPKRCKDCRERKRDVRRNEPRLQTRVRCARCGSQIYVPFLPQGVKPVYCRICYKSFPIRE